MRLLNDLLISFAKAGSRTGSGSGGGAASSGNPVYSPPVEHVHLHSVLNGTLPAFMVVYVAVATTKLLSRCCGGGISGEVGAGGSSASESLLRFVALLDIER